MRLLLLFVSIIGAMFAQTASKIEMKLGTPPTNPAVGKVRIFPNVATGKVECLDSAGTSCWPAGTHNANADTGTTATCFQLDTDAGPTAGPKLCADAAGGYVMRDASDNPMLTVDVNGVMTLGNGTAEWNLTGITDATPPGAPGVANQFTANVDRATGLFNYHLNGQANAYWPALGKWVTFTGPTQARSYALPDSNGTTLATTAYADGVVTAALKTRPCEIHIWGSGAAGALQNTDDEPASCMNKTGATLTITSFECRASTGNTTTANAVITGGASILTGDMTAGNATFAAGTLSGTPTQAANATIDIQVIAAGTANGLICVVGRTL